uniref:Cytochrome P450 n=1 Tax=Heliothis virescens TaxID=7102 RepID=A0A2A4IT41_HELVI
MKNCLEKDDSMKLALALVGNASLVADVPIWRPRRKVLVSTFSLKNLLNFTGIFSKQSMILTEQLQKVAGKGNFSLFDYIMAYSMDSVCETTLGITMNSQQNPDQVVMQAFTGACQLVSDRIIKPWLHFMPLYKLTPEYKQFMECIEIIEQFITKAIQDKRRDMAENNNVKTEDKDAPQFKSFLELMIEASGGASGYTDAELREESALLFIAATDTTTLGACFTSVLLARHPHVQEKVYQELKDVFGDSNWPVTADDLTRLKYMDAVIRESLRLYPSAPMLLRRVDEDVLLPSGVTLPQGSGVMLSVFAAHRNPRYWGEDAELFRPERFIDEPLQHPAAFLAFSYGPRNCIGYRFAMMSMKTVLATLLRQYKILPISKEDLGKPIDLKFDIMLRAADDFQVVLEPRS